MSGEAMSRRVFFQRLLHAGDVRPDRNDEPDWLAMLPPDFSGGLLEAEAARLGADVSAMTKSEMAKLVLSTMAGAGIPVPRQEDASGEPEGLIMEKQEEKHVGTDPLS